jgi:hypothetical protein
MRNKKRFGFLLIILVVVLLGYFTSDLLTGKGKSDQTLSDFMIEDTASVDKIILSNSYGYSITLVRGDKEWTTVEGQCIQQEPVNNILHTFNKAAVKSFLPQAAIENIKKQITIDYKKVEVFQKGKWIKTWYIGSSTPDHYGAYVLLETAKDGKSNSPVVLEMKGLRGTIEPRFVADSRMWMCTRIFAHSIDEIAGVKLKNFEKPAESFEFKRNEANTFDLFVHDKKQAKYDTLRLVRYLERFKKLHFESPNYTLTQEQADSMRQTVPYIRFSLTEKTGKNIDISAYRMPTDGVKFDFNGDTLRYDENRMWAFIEDGLLVKLQYFVFDPIFIGNSYFLHQ